MYKTKKDMKIYDEAMDQAEQEYLWQKNIAQENFDKEVLPARERLSRTLQLARRDYVHKIDRAQATLAEAIDKAK